MSSSPANSTDDDTIDGSSTSAGTSGLAGADSPRTSSVKGSDTNTSVRSGGLQDDTTASNVINHNKARSNVIMGMLSSEREYVKQLRDVVEVS